MKQVQVYQQVQNQTQSEGLYVFVPRWLSGEVAVRAKNYKQAKKRAKKPFFGWAEIWVVANGAKVRLA